MSGNSKFSITSLLNDGIVVWLDSAIAEYKDILLLDVKNNIRILGLLDYL